MSAGSEVSIYDRMCWPEGELERALASGAHRRELTAYLGAGEYATLRARAAPAQRRQHPVRPRRTRPGRARAAAMKVYLLPGILGSQLGRPRAAAEPPDLLWLDPTDVVKGRLMELAWAPGGEPSGHRQDGGNAPRPAPLQPLQPLGAIVYSYLALKLRLAAAGFAVVLYDYDWRDDLEAAGDALAGRLEAEPADELALVGHSMGGLLARRALACCSAGTATRIRRLVGIGAPHGGAIAAVQALRGTYPVVCRLAAIDREHDAQTLTTGVFRTFMSLYQMLPAGGAAPDLFEPGNWPRAGAQPDPALLQAARGFGRRLASADPRFVSIIGTGQRTVTGIERRGEQFRYTVTAAGDGTVAAARATLPGARAYSVRCEHSELPRNPTVAAALIEILRGGRTRRLREGARARFGRSAYVTDQGLRRAFGHKLDWSRMHAHERRRYLNFLNEPPAAYRPPPAR